VLAHHEVQAGREHHRIEGQARADEPVDPSRIAKWTTAGDQKEFPLIRHTLDGVAGYWGYSFDDPARRAPLSSGGSLLFGGKEAKARVERFPELELMTRGEPPIHERPYHPRHAIVVPTAHDRPRFVPGERDASLGPPPGPLRAKAHEAVKRLPEPVRLRVRQAGRAVGLARKLPPPPEPTNLEP
jgi:hypothetical protein